MAKHKVDISGINTSKLKVLKQDEIIELLNRLKNGDESARNELVEGNLRLVLSVIKKFNERHDNLDDLFQIGCIGLIKAINNFDVTHNVKFSTYAVPMIIGEIKRFLRDNSPLRISRQIKDLAYKAMKEKDLFITKYQREPTEEELSKILNVSSYEIKEALDSILSVASLFDPVFSENGDTIYIIDQVKDEECPIERVNNLMALKKGIESLDKFQKRVICDRYYNDKTQFEIAQEFGISQAQVSRIEKSAIRSLKEFF